MKKYIYPKNKFEKIIYDLLGKNVYLNIGIIILFLLLSGYAYIMIMSQSSNNSYSLKIDLDNKFVEPALFDYLEKKTPKKSQHKSGNNIEDENLSSNYEDFIQNNTIEEKSGDEFLFNDEKAGEEQVENKKHYIFGTDDMGRDLFAFLFLGLEIYLIGGLLALSVSLILGTTLGAILGYSKNRVLIELARLFEDVISSFPKIIVLFITIVVFGIKLFPIMITIGILSSAKISKALTERIKYLNKNEYLDSAKQLGLSNVTILFKHILFYNCRDIFIVYSIFIIADMILLELI